MCARTRVCVCVRGDVSKGALVSLLLFTEGLLCNTLESLTSGGQTVSLNGCDGHTQTERYSIAVFYTHSQSDVDIINQNTEAHTCL